MLLVALEEPLQVVQNRSLLLQSMEMGLMVFAVVLGLLENKLRRCRWPTRVRCRCARAWDWRGCAAATVILAVAMMRRCRL